VEGTLHGHTGGKSRKTVSNHKRGTEAELENEEMERHIKKIKTRKAVGADNRRSLTL